jgi:alanyl-tRNA synthetase
MTQRLYYQQPYRATFSATVRSCVPHGDRFEVVLDTTAFYPTSGGQPFDIGTLGSAQVVDVLDRDDGAVVHITNRPLAEGLAVNGEIDWPRRFDHMQQHTGQHVLSAAFDRTFSVRTESFHLGRESSSIDLAREVSASEIRRAEDEANRVVWEDRPVHIRVASADEARDLPLRKESQRTGPLRLIEVEDFDLSACGGTHVARTGAVGVIAVAGWEKFRGGSRIQFLCGARALATFRDWRDALAATGRHLSVPPSELAAAVEKLQLDAKTLQKTIRAQQEQLAVHEARAVVARAESVDGRWIVVEVLDGWDAVGLKALAAAATANSPSLAVVLFSASTPPVTVVAAGTDTGIDSSAVVKALTAKFGGKGGGRRELAQGGGFNAHSDALIAASRQLLMEPQ